MKKFSALLLTLVFISCNCQKGAVTAIPQQADCPDDGTCTMTILKNKKIDIRTNTIGKKYYELADSNDKDVVRYEYVRKVDTTLADSGYREEIVFEMDKANPEMQLTGASLQKTNMIFGRFCFCRGQTGIYAITTGNLSVKKQGAKYVMDLEFKTEEVPQVLTKVRAELK